MVKAVVDLHLLAEDDRIAAIGNQVLKFGKPVGFFVDDEDGKAERYLEKLQTRFPSIRLRTMSAGVVPGTYLVTVELKPPVAVKRVG